MSREEQQRRELIQDVLDRILSHPEYLTELIELNKKYSTNFVEDKGVRKQIKTN